MPLYFMGKGLKMEGLLSDDEILTQVRALLLRHGLVPLSWTSSGATNAIDTAWRALAGLDGEVRDSPQFLLLFGLVGLRVGEVNMVSTTLGNFVSRHAVWPELDLLAAMALEAAGERVETTRLRRRAIRKAHSRGVWRDDASTPAPIRPLVSLSIERCARDRRDLYLGVLDEVETAHGRSDLERFRRSVLAYLGELDLPPADAMQRPTLYYYPGLSDRPTYDPLSIPFASDLMSAYSEIRDEASAVMEGSQGLQSFLDIPEGGDSARYLGGASVAPRWDAFFFYRHGQVFEANHSRAPVTSRVLQSLDLCRVPGQAPEVCFSFIAPRTVIKSHHGVTNTRLVAHLPLIVPNDCALHIVNREVHRWQPGKLFVFDDTFLHEAWNHSDRPRAIVLMDTWHPELSQAERVAVSAFVQRLAQIE